MAGFSESDVKITQLPSGYVRQACRLLANAFDEDPVITHFLRDRRRRELVYGPLFFEPIVRLHLHAGHVHSAWVGNELAGVFATRPHNYSPAPLSARLYARMADLALHALFPGAARELSEGFDAASKLHPSRPHYYMLFMGVNPRYHGMGIGTKLFAAVCNAADRDKMLCYLETPTERAQHLYERAGFRLTGEHRPFRGAPPIWTMEREPQPL